MELISISHICYLILYPEIARITYNFDNKNQRVLMKFLCIHQNAFRPCFINPTEHGVAMLLFCNRNEA